MIKKLYCSFGLSFVLALTACGNQALEGEYKNQGNGIYSAIEFKASPRQ
jgi:hypothetical protein